MRTLSKVFVIVLYICCVSDLNSQENYSTDNASIDIQALTTPINFDGKLEEGEWTNYKTIPLVSHWPQYAEEPNKKTTLYTAFDDQYLYVAAMCYEDLEKIQGQTFERDIISMSMDAIAIVLDTYDDNENAVFFSVTPTGSRIDASVRNDAQGDAPLDVSWNSFWEAKVSRTTDAWMTEVRIPFSSLRFQSKGDKVTMGMILYRYAAGDREMDIFPKVKPNWGFWSFAKPSQAQEVVISEIKNKRPWFTSPYALANAGYHHEPSTLEYPNKINDNKITAGLDVQHALTDNLNLDLTLNTDFAQVEADDQVVNLSRFSLFFPEKRRFFLERSSIMDFQFENNNRLFYSRKIGINDGNIVPLWGGARVVGRVKDFDVGLMTMQSREVNSIAPENFGILRLRKKVSKSNSYIGGILTNRTDFQGNTLLTYGLDGIINVFKNDYLQLNFANSYDSGDPKDYNHFLEARKRIFMMWENRSQVGLNYNFSYSQADQDYNPAMGFEERRNFKALGNLIGYGWFVKNEGSLRYIRMDLQSKAFLTSNTNKLESYLISPSFQMEWDKSNSLQLTYNHFYDRVPVAFNLSSDIVIPSASYVNRDIELMMRTPPVNFLNATFTGTFGSFYDGNRISLGLTPTYIVSKFFTLSGFYQYNRIAFDTDLYNAHVARLKISSSFNVKLSLNAFIQYNSLSKTNAINVRLRYNSKDGNDLYIVYNETLNGNGQFDPLIPYSDFRGLTLKYIHTFKL